MVKKVPAQDVGPGSIAGPGSTLVTLGQLAIDASGDGSKFLAGDGAFKTGGNAIQPETGSSIKISTFPNATLPMGPSDRVTGLQGGANVNFSQAQILSGQNGSTGDDAGYSLNLTAGNGAGRGAGGHIYLTAGNQGVAGGGGVGGGNVNILGGNSYNSPGGNISLLPGYLASAGHGYPGQFNLNGAGASSGGDMQMLGGDGPGGSAGNGGGIYFQGGESGWSGGQGGTVTIRGGRVRSASSGASAGAIEIAGGYGGGYGFVTPGGDTLISGGSAAYGDGGYAGLFGGSPNDGGNGGDVALVSGQGVGGTYKSGDLFLGLSTPGVGAAPGNVFPENWPTSDPAVAGALWLYTSTVLSGKVVIVQSAG